MLQVPYAKEEPRHRSDGVVIGRPKDTRVELALVNLTEREAKRIQQLDRLVAKRRIPRATILARFRGKLSE